jgi:hypothetical protein
LENEIGNGSTEIQKANIRHPKSNMQRIGKFNGINRENSAEDRSDNIINRAELVKSENFD